MTNASHFGVTVIGKQVALLSKRKCQKSHIMECKKAVEVLCQKMEVTTCHNATHASGISKIYATILLKGSVNDLPCMQAAVPSHGINEQNDHSLENYLIT